MQKLSLSCTVVFLLLILLLTARILADISAHKLGQFAGGRQSVSSPAQTADLNRQINFQSLSPILEKGLFGTATRGSLLAIEQQTNQTTEAAPTIDQSDLLLLGTVAGRPSASYALIRKISSNEERVFKVGEQVFNLGALKAVGRDIAEVDAKGRTVILKTPEAALEQDTPVAAVAPPAPTASASSNIGVVIPPPGGVGIIDQRALNAALDNIGQAMTDARLLPNMNDGVVEGFKLSEVKPQGVFGALGLKNGDVLAKINDFPIDSPEKAIQSFMTLKGQNRIKLDLIRDGAPTSMSYDIR